MAADERRTPRELREARKRDVARVLVRALVDCPTPHYVIAGDLGVSPALFGHWIDPGRPESPLVVDLLGLPPDLRRPLANLIADSLACVLAELPHAANVADDLQLLAETIDRCAAATAGYSRMLSDRAQLAAAPAAALEPHLDAAIKALVDTRARVREVLLTRGDAARGPAFRRIK